MNDLLPTVNMWRIGGHAFVVDRISSGWFVWAVIDGEQNWLNSDGKWDHPGRGQFFGTSHEVLTFVKKHKDD